MNASRFRTIQAELKISNAELAILLGGCHPRSVQRWRADERPISAVVAELMQRLREDKKAGRTIYVR